MSHWKTMLSFGVPGAIGLMAGLEFLRRTVHCDLLENSAVGTEGKLIFYGDRTAKDILGVPIKEYHVDSWNGKINYNNDYETEINIPVEGTKTKGYIHCEGRKNLITGDWVLTALSLKSEDLQTTMHSIIPPEDEVAHQKEFSSF